MQILKHVIMMIVYYEYILHGTNKTPMLKGGVVWLVQMGGGQRVEQGSGDWLSSGLS